jgi:hypothetical protein
MTSINQSKAVAKSQPRRPDLMLNRMCRVCVCVCVMELMFWLLVLGLDCPRRFIIGIFLVTAPVCHQLSEDATVVPVTIAMTAAMMECRSIYPLNLDNRHVNS